MSNGQSNFIPGLFVKNPNERAPDYIIGKVSINRNQMLSFLQHHQGDWINGEIKRSRDGNLYCAIDNWQPQQRSDYDHSQPAQQQPAQAPPPPFPGNPAPQGGYADQPVDNIPF